VTTQVHRCSTSPSAGGSEVINSRQRTSLGQAVIASQRWVIDGGEAIGQVVVRTNSGPGLGPGPVAASSSVDCGLGTGSRQQLRELDVAACIPLSELKPAVIQLQQRHARSLPADDPRILSLQLGPCRDEARAVFFTRIARASSARGRAFGSVAIIRSRSSSSHAGTPSRDSFGGGPINTRLRNWSGENLSKNRLPSRQLGHKDIRTTMRYAHHAPELTPGIFDRLAEGEVADRATAVSGSGIQIS
jgi:hypothetical protein